MGNIETKSVQSIKLILALSVYTIFMQLHMYIYYNYMLQYLALTFIVLLQARKHYRVLVQTAPLKHRPLLWRVEGFQWYSSSLPLEIH